MLRTAPADRRVEDSYSIYVYHRPSNENAPHARWEKHAVISDLKVAKKEAKALHRMRRYPRIELHYAGHLARAPKIVKIYRSCSVFARFIDASMGVWRAIVRRLSP